MGDFFFWLKIKRAHKRTQVGPKSAHIAPKYLGVFVHYLGVHFIHSQKRGKTIL